MTDHQHTASVLNRAADLIEERGWRRGCGWPVREGETTPLCIEGGILAATGQTFVSVDLEEFWECPSYRAVADHLALPYTRTGHETLTDDEALWAWNDRSASTAAEVIEVLRATAVIEQARADEHTDTDTGYDTTAAMREVADDAAARTLAGLR